MGENSLKFFLVGPFFHCCRRNVYGSVRIPRNQKNTEEYLKPCQTSTTETFLKITNFSLVKTFYYRYFKGSDRRLCKRFLEHLREEAHLERS